MEEETTIVLLAIYLACKGSTKANVSLPYIQKKIPRKQLMRINLRKTLKQLEKRGLIWKHSGRRANGGATYGITKQGIKYLKQNKLI